MLIVDVIREAENEYEIYFLLTSYVEAVRYCDKLTSLPDPMRELPFVGTEDVRARIEALAGELGKPSREADRRDHDIVREAMAIFTVALNRLVSLKVQSAPDADGRLAVHSTRTPVARMTLSHFASSVPT